MSSTLQNFCDNLRTRLNRGDLTITALAAEADVHRVTLHKILAGKIQPSLTVCEKIAAAAGIPADKIFAKSRRRKQKTA